MSVLSRLPDEWRVPAAFAALSLLGLVYGTVQGSLWQRAHDTAWVAVPLSVLLIVLLLRRSRVAWWILVAFFTLGTVGSLVRLIGPPDARWVVGNMLGLIEFGLLLSRPMRRFVWRRDGSVPTVAS